MTGGAGVRVGGAPCKVHLQRNLRRTQCFLQEQACKKSLKVEIAERDKQLRHLEERPGKGSVEQACIER